MPNQCKVCKNKLLVFHKELFDFPNITSDGRPWKKGRSLAFCDKCGLYQRVLAEGINFDDVYHGYAGFKHGGDQINFNGKPTGRTEKILREINIPEPKSILDIGSGNGCGIEALAKRWPSSAVTGYDPHGSAPGILKDRPDGKFDLITMFHVLEHIDEPLEILAYIRNSLSRGGRILIQVPYSVNWPFDFIIADHIWHFTIRFLSVLLDKAGFGTIRINNNIIAKEITAIASVGRNNNNSPVPIGENINDAVKWLIDYKKFLENIDEPVAVFGTGPAQAWAGLILGDNVVCYYDDDRSRFGSTLNHKAVLQPSAAGWKVIAPFYGAQLDMIKSIHRQCRFL